MLPDDFSWYRRPDSGGTAWLSVGKKTVAVLDKRLDGSWFTTVNRHRPSRMWLTETCGSAEQGRRWIERWAAAHAERLRAEPDGFANSRAWDPIED